jgi:hypothetical protein
MAKAKTMAKAKAKAKAKTKTKTESPIEREAREAAVEGEAELRSLLAAIREHEREIAARFYDLGLALKRIVDRKLYGVRNHASLEALLRAEGLLSERQATKLIQVVTRVKREHALSLGLEKTYALLGYTAATPEADSVAGLLEDGGAVAGVAAAKASLRQIGAATRDAKAASGKARPATPQQKLDAKLARAVAAALREVGLRGAAVKVSSRDVRVVLPKDAAERWLAKR